MDSFLTLLGLGAAGIGVVSAVPQMRRLTAGRGTVGVSFSSQLLLVCSSGLWLAYGLLLLDPAQIFANAPSLVLGVLVLAGLFRAMAAGRAQVKAAVGAIAFVAACTVAAALAWRAAGPGGVGTVAVPVGLVRWGPQLRLAYSGRDLHGIAPWALLLNAASAVLWAVYGLGYGQVPVWSSALAGLGLTLAVLYRRCPPRVVVRALHRGRWGEPGRRLVAPVASYLLDPA